MSNQPEEGLKKAYSVLETGKPGEAKKILEEIYLFNLDNNEIEFAVWCCSYWIDCVNNLQELSPIEQGETLIYQWKSFEEALRKKKDVYTRAIYAVQTGIFTLALNSYSSLTSDTEKENFRTTVQKADVYHKLGICNKKLGKYEVALTSLNEANKLLPLSAATLAEMADCYALCGLERQAKVLFREAFYINAKAIDLELLDSELIRCLIKQVKEKGYSGPVLQEWVPVFGILYGIFNVKRELRSQEVGILKQHIFETEVELKNPANNIKILTPRLIYMYFLLLDHYIQKNEMDSKISNILLKIKILDEDVYNLYVK